MLNFTKMQQICLFILGILAFSVANAQRAYDEALDTFSQSAEVSSMLSSAYGYALFPTVGKGGIGIGGAHGKGKVYRGGVETGESSMTQITIGFQLGGQAYSQLILFEDQSAFDNFTNGNFEFSAQATAVAITASANVQTGTTGNSRGASGAATAGRQDARYVNGMAIFTFAKGGLMYEASLGGQKFTYEAN